MEDFDVSSKQDLEQFESAYNEELMAEQGASPNTKFNYAFCLVRSPHRDDISFGLQLLSELGRLPEYQRDFMFYSALGCYRLHDYVAAKNFLEGLLSLEPHNRQAISLKKKVEVHITKDGLIGLAIIGGVAAVAGLVGALVLKR
eukprot:Opistho-2@33676